jgi:predicted double-glycine peptidase
MGRCGVLLLFVVFVAAGIGSVETALASDITVHQDGARVAKPLMSVREIKTRYIIQQEYDFSCGAAAIATLLTFYFGDPATEKEIILGIAERADMGKVLQRRAFSLLDMKRFAQARGYEAVGYKMDFDFLVELDQPVIVPVTIRDYKHFVIFKGVVEDRVLIADPAFGNTTMRVGNFLTAWPSRVGFVLKRKEGTRPPAEDDHERRARFMSPTRLGRLAVAPGTPGFTPIPGQVQSITGPRSAGSFADFFNIRVPTP